jgi:hypothetical protein
MGTTEEQHTTCACGWPAAVIVVQTTAGVVRVTDCMQCDRTTCRSCGNIVPQRKVRACSCGARLPMVMVQRSGW